MANCGKDILLNCEGTEQNQRFLEALDPGSVKLNDYGVKEWMRFAYNFAQKVKFFDTANSNVAVGDWKTFFKAESELESFLQEVEKGRSITPHLALFITFLKLLDLSKARFNRITQSHLDFYFEEILKLEKKPATPDRVHVLFELAKNALNEKIAEQTELDGGKDSNGKKLIYKTTEELVANLANVASVKSVYCDLENKKIKSAQVANSYDGKGAEFPNKDAKWWPFGYYESPPVNADEADTREYPELEDAQPGFAVSGKIFELKEGERKVTIAVKISSTLKKTYSGQLIGDCLEVFCTGERGWLGPFVFDDTSGTSVADPAICRFSFVIPKDEGAIVAWDPKIHGGNYQPGFPVCKLLFKTDNPEAVDLYSDLVGKNIEELVINVDVKRISGMELHNDVGAIDATKPFYPFGTVPVKKSKFYVGYDELFNKKWENLTVDIEWKNTPSNFKDWYFAYRKPETFKISPVSYIFGIFRVFDNEGIEVKKTSELKALPANYTVKINKKASNLYVSGDDYFRIEVEKKEKGEWDVISGLSNKSMFSKDSDIFRLNLVVANTATEKDKVGPIRLSLRQSFLHEMYPRLYALAMTSENKDVIIPNEPYTPFVEQIVLSYKASATIKVEAGDYLEEDFKLYHEYPFGQALQSLELKKSNGILKNGAEEKLALVPEFRHGGNLYLGIENALPRQIVSLLVQVLEGSEKPDMNTGSANNEPVWAVLCNNDWKKLSASDIISDKTGSFLQSGIFKFIVPKEATTNNTLLPSGYVWLRASISKEYNLVSKAIGIHAQAVEARLTVAENQALESGNALAAESISKMLVRSPKVKKILQPYSSFGGVPAETDSDFYRRVSERLRHKNRSVTAWDYEHLVLQQFSEIYKVKCLNHTNGETTLPSFLAPGHTTLVVIPDIVNKNVFDIYKPSVSAATLNKIRNYLEEKSSKLIELHVINPVYEELQVKLKAKFRKGFDENYYCAVLEKDITNLISPWAFDLNAGIRFGHSFNKSVLVKFVEDLDYVDFVSDVKLFQSTADSRITGGTEVKSASPSSPLAIMVSARKHDVQVFDDECLT